VTPLSELRVKIFADGADLAGIREMDQKPWIKGFTTNPTLMRKAGIGDYESFAKEILKFVRKPISFEVFADDPAGMVKQARQIASWGSNVYVKIPVTNTNGESTSNVIRELSKAGIQLNITAVMTLEQVQQVALALHPGCPSVISIFAGRIADSGRDPIPIMQDSLNFLRKFPWIEFLWASPREVLNIIQANDIGCHIITVTNDLLAKVGLFGKDLGEFSLDTVKMFYNDAKKAGYRLEE
jgi:transaldolase